MSERAQALEAAEPWREQLDRLRLMAENADGDWDLSDNDRAAIRAALDRLAAPPVGVSPQPDTRRDCTCLGTCRGAEGLGPRWKCAIEPSACLAPVEPTPPAEDEDDDEVPVARAEGALDKRGSR